MKFRTEIEIAKPVIDLNHKHRLLIIGSCFTENIGNRLKSCGFTTNINPFGIVYNPASIKQQISRIATQNFYNQNDLQFANERWFNYDFHSIFSETDADTCLNKINNSLFDSHQFLKSTSHVLITLGTAYTYTNISNNQIVSNCHKIPSAQFRKRILNTLEVKTYLSDILKTLKGINPDIKIIFTLSPVRHFNDGIIENQRSKSTLHVAIQEIIEESPNTFYFPAYEIVMDDLRDYRFYNQDLTHPNEMAVEYIWEKFCSWSMELNTINLCKKVEQINKALLHKPFNSESNSFKQFQQNIQEQILDIKNNHPEVLIDQINKKKLKNK